MALAGWYRAIPAVQAESWSWRVRRWLSLAAVEQSERGTFHRSRSARYVGTQFTTEFLLQSEVGEEGVTSIPGDGEVLGAEGGGAADVGLEERRRPERVADEPRAVVQEEVVAVATPVAQGEFRRGQLHDSNPQRRYHVQLWPADAEPTSINHRGPWRLGW